MAEAPDASKPPHYPPMVKLVNYEKGNAHKITSEIQFSLCHGMAVLVNGWEPEDAMKFCKDDLESYRSPITQEIMWQGV